QIKAGAEKNRALDIVDAVVVSDTRVHIEHVGVCARAALEFFVEAQPVLFFARGEGILGGRRPHKAKHCDTKQERRDRPNSHGASILWNESFTIQGTSRSPVLVFKSNRTGQPKRDCPAPQLGFATASASGPSYRDAGLCGRAGCRSCRVWRLLRPRGRLSGLCRESARPCARWSARPSDWLHL